MMAILLALSLALLVGATLGLLGGGGSILTVPLLTYVVGMEARSAIASSLFVVAVTSASAAVVHARARRVDWRTGLVFGVAGTVGAFIGGRASVLVPARALMLLFAAMMIAAAAGMLRRLPSTPRGDAHAIAIARGRVLVLGATVGLVTGLVGAGGGFVVVPALVVLGGLPMPTAVGTSLVVISMNAIAGLAGHVGRVAIDWPITLAIAAATVAGSFVGSRLVGRIDPVRLRHAFAALVVVTAVVVLAAQLWPG